MPKLDDLAATGDILWKCQQCERMEPVNVEAVRTVNGGDYDLADKTAACRTPGCGYWVTFYFRQGGTLRGLVTPDFQMKLSFRRSAWLLARKRKSPPDP